MAPIETQKNNAEQPLDPDSRLMLDRMEDTRKILSIPDDGSWNGIIEKIAAPLPKPETSFVKNAIAHSEIERRYQVLMNLGVEAKQVLKASLAYVDEKKPLAPEDRETILRFVGRYVEEADVYQAMHKGRTPSGSPLPTYLGEFVASRETDRVASKVTSLILPIQFDARDKAKISQEVKPSQLTNESNQIVTCFIRMRTRMDRVSDCYEGGNLSASKEPYVSLLQAAGYQPPEGSAEYSDKQIDAAKLLVAYLSKYKEEIQKYADISADGKVEDLLISEALECAAEGSLVGQLLQQVSEDAKDLFKGNMPDMRNLISKVFDNKEMFAGRATEIVLAPLSALSSGSETDRNQFQKNATAVIGFFMNADSKTLSILQLSKQVNDHNPEQKKMIYALVDRVTGPGYIEKTVETMRKATLLPDDPNNPIVSKLTELIRGKTLTARETFDIYYLTNVKSGNLLLAYKAVDILNSHNEPELATKLQMHLFKQLRNIAVSNAGDITEFANKMGLDEKQTAELQNVRLRLEELGVGALYTLWNKYYAFVAEFPEIGIPLTVFSLWGTGKFVAQGFYTAKIRSLEDFSKMGFAEAQQKFKLPATFTQDAFERAQAQVRAVVTEYNLICRRWHIPIVTPGGKLNEGKTMIRAVESGELKKMAQAYKNRFPNATDVARELRPIAESEQQLRSALTDAGYSANDVDAALKATAGMNTAPMVAQPAPDQNSPAKSVPASPAAPPKPTPPPAKPAAPSAPARSVPPPPAPPKVKRPSFDPNAQPNTRAPKEKFVLTEQTTIAELHSMATELGIKIDGRSEADVLADVRAKLNVKK